MNCQKNGINALGLHRVLGLGSYQTAWTCLHKLRYAMVRPRRERLSGTVEVDETWLGGLESGVHGRQTETKVLIVVAAEEDGAGIGRVRLQSIPESNGYPSGAILKCNCPAIRRNGEEEDPSGRLFAFQVDSQFPLLEEGELKTQTGC